MVAYGSAQRTITLPRPGPRPNGTLTSSVPRGFTFDDSEPANVPENFQWGGGVALAGEPCGGFTVEAINCEVTSFSGDTRWGANYVFAPIVVWTSRVATSISGRGDEVSEAAARILDEQVGFALAQELYSGLVSGNPSIRKDPVVIAGSALPIDDLLCSVEEAIVARVGNMRSTIHVPAGLLNRLATNSSILFSDGAWFTPTGHLVIGDGAYSGAAPIINGTPMSAPAAGDGYVYVTGPVAWDYGPEMLFEPVDVGNGYHRTNTIRGQAQRPVLGVYDPACIHLALLADVC